MSNVRIVSRTKLLLPKFVDALLGIVCSSQVHVSSVRVRSGCIGPRTLYRPWEEGRGGWAGLWLSTKTLQSLKAVTWVWRKCRKSGMVDLRRFPVSDEFISDRYTFCTIFDRKHFLDFLNYWFWEKWSRDRPTRGNVGNRRADRMEALSDSCGTVFRSKYASEEPKSRFWRLRHLFSEFGEI